MKMNDFIHIYIQVALIRWIRWPFSERIANGREWENNLLWFRKTLRVIDSHTTAWTSQLWFIILINEFYTPCKQIEKRTTQEIRWAHTDHDVYRNFCSAWQWSLAMIVMSNVTHHYRDAGGPIGVWEVNNKLSENEGQSFDINICAIDVCTTQWIIC